jgi:hypothetical protein
MAELVTPQVGRLFQPDDDHGLLRALEEADSLRTPEARAAARATADRFDPATLSAEFAREVRARVRTAVPAGA